MLGSCCCCCFFFWMSSCLGASLATSDQGTDVVESCFLYPVNDGTSSPYYDISGEGDHFVTVNHIFNETNVVRFVDERGNCVVGLTLNTSDCNETLPSDGEYTTLVYRRLNDTLKAYKTNSLVDVVDLSPDIQKLRITSNKMVNVAFDCPGNCYTFEKATIHINYTQVTGSSSFKMFGRKKPSPDENHLLTAGVVNGLSMNLFQTVTFNKPDLGHEWFQLEFHVSFIKQVDGTYPYYRMELNAENLWNGKQDNYNLTLSTKDLYLNFSQSVNILWAIPCIPPNLEIGQAQQRQSDIIMALGCACAILAVMLITVALCLYRHRTFSPAVDAFGVLLPPPPPPPPADAAAVPTPPNSVGDSSVGGTVETDRTSLMEHQYDYIDLTVLREQMAEEEAKSRGDSAEQRGPSEGRKSHTSINSVYGLVDANETVS